jgi:simple sugar transport system ATP-binding protein
MTSARPAAAPGPVPADRPVAEALGVSKRFGLTVALDGVGITVRPGESHALVGRNGAGKSTLVSVLTGLQRPDSGQVAFGGEQAPAIADRDAWRASVACVYQKSTIIPSLTVAENLYLNRQPTRRARLISWSTMRREARQLLVQWDVDVDVQRPAAALTVEQRQLVEIARALSFGTRFIILDEPTAQLDAPAIARLFDRMRDLQAQGVTFLYISHHLQEIYQVCQTVTVLRDARHVVTAPVADLRERELVSAMTGDAEGLVRTAGAGRTVPAGSAAVLRVNGLSRHGEYHGVSFTVRAGEVVGLAGGGSSGRVPVAETVVGLRTADEGTVEITGRRVRPGSVPSALAAGLGFLPQDRHHSGLVPELSVAENATLTITDRLGPAGLIAPRKRTEVAQRLIDDLTIKTTGPQQPVSGLSGGNQQKVVMARALANSPRVLVLISPTAGVDVRSKEALLGVVDTVREAGSGVVIASDELDDLRPCDRVLVMFHGRLVLELPRGWRDNDLVAAMEGVDQHRD